MITLEMILDWVAVVFETTEKELKSRSQKRSIVEARRVYCVAAIYAGFGISEVAKSVNRHHALMYNTIEYCIYQALADKEYRKKISKVIQTTNQHEKKKNSERIGIFCCAINAML